MSTVAQLVMFVGLGFPENVRIAEAFLRETGAELLSLSLSRNAFTPRIEVAGKEVQLLKPSIHQILELKIQYPDLLIIDLEGNFDFARRYFKANFGFIMECSMSATDLIEAGQEDLIETNCPEECRAVIGEVKHRLKEAMDIMEWLKRGKIYTLKSEKPRL
ncbi:MAG: hypothetical protein WC244_03050 [Patescibacteria group bacterium]|jgi:hypothetical protein